MSLERLRSTTHKLYLQVRNCNHIIQSANFEIAFNLASNFERKGVESFIQNLNKAGILKFIDEHLEDSTPFEQMGIRKLRAIGQHMKIRNYNRLNKLTLIEEIENVVTRLKENSKRSHIQSKGLHKDREDSA